VKKRVNLGTMSALAAVVSAIAAIWACQEARRANFVSLESTVTGLIRQYLVVDARIEEWENSRGFVREQSAVTLSDLDDLDRVLEGVHAPPNVISLYKDRLALYQALENFKEEYGQVAPRLGELVGDLPKPALPAGRLRPMKGSVDAAWCQVGGIRRACSDLLRM